MPNRHLTVESLTTGRGSARNEIKCNDKEHTGGPGRARAEEEEHFSVFRGSWGLFSVSEAWKKARRIQTVAEPCPR